MPILSTAILVVLRRDVLLVVVVEDAANATISVLWVGLWDLHLALSLRQLPDIILIEFLLRFSLVLS